MTYAVVQLDLAPPSVEALRQAFSQTQTLRPQDAASVARDAFGILAQRLSAPEALTLCGVLKELGVATDVVDEHELPELPQAKLVSRIDCLDVGLVLYDALGRQTIVDWGRVVLVCAGKVGLIDLVSQEAQYFAANDGDGYAMVRRNSRYAEKARTHLLLDIFLQGPERYRADAAKLRYDYLGPRRKGTAAANFDLLVADLVGRATRAVPNHGAEAVRAGRGFAYPSRKAFEKETIWRLWNAARKA